MAISYEDYKKKIQEKYKYTTERNPRKPLNQRYNAIARGSYYDISENALDTAINRYNTYGEAIGSMSNFSDKAINSALEQATNNMNTYKSNIIDAAKKNNIETSNNKNIVKSQLEYGKEELDYLRNNKYEALKNVKEPLKLTDVASSAQKKYKENKEKFDELVKENEDYKEYDEYLYNAVPLLQNMKNINEVNKEGVNTADKILVPVISGARNSLRNIFMPSSGEYRLANNNLVNLPTKSDVKAEKVLNSYDTGVGEFLGKTAYSIGQQLPSMAIGLATGGLGTAAGASASAINAARTVGSLSSMFANVSRNTTNQKLMEGYTKEQANQYGLMSGAVETATELMFGGLGKLMGTGALDRVVTDRLTRNIQNRVFRTLADAGISSVGEGVEEVVSDLLQPVVQQIALDDPRKYSEILADENMLEDFLVGTISSLIMSAPSTVVSFANNNQNNNQVNNTNQVNLPPAANLQDSVVNDAVNSRIDQNSINVPIINRNQNINSYQNINEAMYEYANNIKDNFETNINIKTSKSTVPVDYSTQSQTSIFNKAKSVFSKIGKNVFKNNGENIYVSNSDIKESIAKTIRNTNQKKLLAEHIEVFENLDKIIENGQVIARGSEMKGRSQYKNWDYYATPITINGENYIVEFDTVLRDNGQKHFRLERIYSLNEATQKQVAPTGKIENQSVNRFVEQPVSMNNNSTNLTQSQIAPLPLNNMQNDSNNMQDVNLLNSNRVMNPIEISQLTTEDANTTPILPNIQRNQASDGESRFYSNIRDKTNMLNEQQKQSIMSEEEVQYYDKVTNKESLEEAFSKLNENGQNETLNWFSKDSEDATAVDVAEGWILLKQYADNNDTEGMVAVAKKMREIGTKAGQTVQAFNIMARMTPEGMVKYAQSELSEAYDRMVKGKTQKWIEKHQKDFDLTPQETGAIMEIMKKVSTMEDGYDKRVELAKIQKIMTDKLPPARGAGIKSWMRISMLFNAKTQVRNVAGNAIIAPVNAFSDLFASMADKVVGAKTGYRTTGVTNIKNYVKGFKEGAYQSYNDFRKGINTRNIQGNRFEISEGKSFNNNTPIGKALNRVDSLLSFMLDAGDRTFYEATFTNSINNQLVLNNTTEVTQEMIDIATQEALSRTWQDNNNYTRFVLSVRKMLNNINLKGYGLGDVLIPFAKTPANLTKAIVDYSPAGLINTLVKGKKLKNAIQTGQFTPQMQHEFVQSLGKATIGTMLYIAGYALAKAGIVSGESDDDKDVQNFMKNTLGVNSYSIKIGDMSFTYDWAQPIAAPLSIMANIVQKDKEDASTLETIISSLDTAGNILLEQSFMESINTALSNNDGLATGIEEAILDLPARAIPTFMKQIVDLTDDTQRTSFEYDKPIQSMINSIKAKIPGLSQTLAPSVDTMGREIQRYGGNNNIFNVFLNPANVSTENISESAEEIYRLYKETGETNIMPRVAPYYINQDGEKITLDSNTRAEYQKASGKIIEDNVKNLLDMKEYQNMSDEKKASVIKDIVNYSYSIAQKEVLDIELSATYKKAYEYSKIGNISDYYTFRNNIDDTDSNTKRESIKNYLINSSLNDNQISHLYGNYYSSEEILNNLIEMRIPIKEFIKFDSTEFESDYNSRTGKTISNSRKKKVIQYVNSLNLNIPQKAILIKMEYNSYDNYNNQIVNYINGLNKTANDKKVLLRSIGFDNFNKDVVKYINSQNISIAEKEEKLKKLGFTIRNGRVYW